MSTVPGTVAGSCLCGAVKFTITLPTKWCAHCHCSMCRRAHGAAFVTFVGVPVDQFRIDQGAEAIKRHASSTHATRSFCRHCGSPFLFQGDKWPGEVHVTRASLQGQIDRKPQAHVYWDHRADWLDIKDDLPHVGTTSK
jgi:hypothetical protein